MERQARIIGTGSYLPERVLSNRDLEKMVETSDEWIVQRTGMRERRIAAPEEATSDMGTPAALQALERAGTGPEELDLILVATMTPDYLSPSTAAIIQSRIGAAGAAAVDIQAACSGYLYALSIAKAYIESGTYRTILVVASEKMSSVVDFTDRSTCILFGDGASAAVVKGEGAGLKIGPIVLGADGRQAEILKVPAGGSRMPATKESVEAKMHFVQIEGQEVFKHAVRRMAQAAEKCLEIASLTQEEVTWVVPHQANLRIMEAISKSLNLPDEKIYKTIHKYGNTSASSVAIALDELCEEKNLEPGDHMLLVAFGAGLTWGALLLTKAEQ